MQGSIPVQRLKQKLADATSSLKADEQTAERLSKELEKAAARITGHKSKIEIYNDLIKEAGAVADASATDSKPDMDADKSKPSTKPERRYREEGPTTDIIRLIANNSGILMDVAVDQLATIAKDQEAGDIRRLINRQIREGYIDRDDAGRLSLSWLGKRAWDSSPLSKVTA